MRRLKKLSRRPWTSGLLAGCLAGVALLATASAASAATYRPTRTDDPAPNGCKKKDCSLREAVIAANASGTPATILLRPGKRYVLTRKGAGENAALTGDLDITSGPLTVKTEGGGKTDPATIDANGIDRIFDGSLTLIGVTLRDGHARTVAGDGGAGGAIRGVNLDIRNSRLVNNIADYHPSNSSPQRQRWRHLRRERRRAQARPDAAQGQQGPRHGRSDLHLAGRECIPLQVDPRKQRDRVLRGRAGHRRGWARRSQPLDHLRQQRLAQSGGGIGLSAPLQGPTATLQVENSTVANNSAGNDGGGIGSEDLIDSGSHATVELDHVTVARNQADREAEAGEGEHVGSGGGIYTTWNDSLSIHNTIVALNTVCHSPDQGRALPVRLLRPSPSPLPVAGAQPDRQRRRLHRLRRHRPVRREAEAGQARRQRRPHQDDRADEGFEGDRPRGARCASRRPAWRQAGQEARHRRLRAESEEVAKVLLSMQSG